MTGYLVAAAIFWVGFLWLGSQDSEDDVIDAVLLASTLLLGVLCFIGWIFTL